MPFGPQLVSKYENWSQSKYWKETKLWVTCWVGQYWNHLADDANQSPFGFEMEAQ